MQVADGDVHPVVIVFAASFDEQHAFAGVGTQTVGEQAARGAGADDDVVKLGITHADVSRLCCCVHGW